MKLTRTKIDWKNNSKRCSKADLSMKCIWQLRGPLQMQMKPKTSCFSQILLVQMRWKYQKTMIVDRFQLCWRCLNAKTWSNLQCHRTKAFEIKALNMRTQLKFWRLESVKIAKIRLKIKSVSKRRTLAASTPRLSCFGRRPVTMSNHRTYSRVFATNLPLAKLGA